jgi:excisionase family DNA binding protein
MKRIPRFDVEPVLLRGDEVAQMLSCSRALAFRWMAAGIIPTIRVPGSRSVRVPKQALLDWIDARTQKGRGLNGIETPAPKNQGTSA